MDHPGVNHEGPSPEAPSPEAMCRDDSVGDLQIAVHSVSRITCPWLNLERFRLDLSRPGGETRRSERVVCGRGDRAAVLAYSDARGMVLLVRVLRIGPLLRGVASGMLLEAPGGLLDGDSPEQAARRELTEETGCTAGDLTRIATVFTSPQFSTEMTHLFLASYDGRPRRGLTLHEDGEVAEAVEIELGQDLLPCNTVVDAKTAILLRAAEARWKPSG